VGVAGRARRLRGRLLVVGAGDVGAGRWGLVGRARPRGRSSGDRRLIKPGRAQIFWRPRKQDLLAKRRGPGNVPFWGFLFGLVYFYFFDGGAGLSAS